MVAILTLALFAVTAVAVAVSLADSLTRTARAYRRLQSEQRYACGPDYAFVTRTEQAQERCTAPTPIRFARKYRVTRVMRPQPRHALAA